tara:strand:+ start:614 stop:898 length:285 start_codon:yes stop_codon:yes gene_type:complete
MQNNITQLHSLEPHQLINPLEEIKNQIENLKKEFQPKEPTEYLTRQEVAELFKVNLSTVHNWTKNGTLISYGMGGSRIYYKRSEIDETIVKLEV